MEKQRAITLPVMAKQPLESHVTELLALTPPAPLSTVFDTSDRNHRAMLKMKPPTQHR